MLTSIQRVMEIGHGGPVGRGHAPAALMERGIHLAAITDLVTRIGDEGAQCLVLQGAAGIGKTSILHRAATAARERDIRVRRAVGDDLETRLPWGMVRQLFGDVPTAQLTGSAALARPVFAPDLAPSTEDAWSPDAFPLLHGLHALTARLAAAEPQLLMLDDLQWSDPQSLRFLSYLLNRADGLAVGLALATRGSGYPTQTSADLAARIASAPATTVQRIGALGPSSVTALVRAALPEATESFCATIHRATGGNPFLCREVLATARAEAIAPTDEGARRLAALRHAGIRTSILVRLGRLGHDAGAVAAAAAVLGADSPIPRVTQLARLDAGSACEAIDLLVAEDVLEVGSGGGVDFVHPIVREAVYADLGPGRRATSHREAARILHREGAAPSESVAHVLAGGLVETWAVPVLRDAAREALRQGAPERAQTLLEAALGATEESRSPDVRLLVELARAEAAAGGSEWALTRFRQVLASLSPGEDDAAVARDIGEALYAAGHLAEASAAFDRGLDLIVAAPSSRRESVVEAQLTAGLDMAGTLLGSRPARVEQMLADAAGSGETRSLASRAVLCLVAGRHAFGVGVPEEQRRRTTVSELARSALEGQALPLDLGTIVLEPVALSLLLAEEFEMARTLLDRLLETAAERGELPAHASIFTIRGLVNLATGELAAAQADGSEALRLTSEIPTVHSQTDAARHVLANASLLLGDRAAAAAALEVADPEERRGGSILRGWWLEASGRLALDRGDAAAARDAFSEAGRRFLAAGGPAAYCPWRSGAALAHHALGEHERALELADEELRLAEEFGAPRAIAEAQLTRARLAPDPEAAARLTATLGLVVDGPSLVRGRVLVDLGAALRRLGRRTAAREHLREGLALARASGARPLAEHAEAELRVAGARRPTSAVSGADALTASERRVAGLAVTGLSNKEIAASLFVTRKTVEVHLSACYRKLGIRSRDELADALG
jgi:DNA-binding CsgD family transcriptional regulator/tetratricopeptide (TPR) repeat protein